MGKDLLDTAKEEARNIWSDARETAGEVASEELQRYKNEEMERVLQDAQTGNPAACFVLGAAYVEEGEEEKGEVYIFAAAQKGLAEAQLYLAVRCLSKAEKQGLVLPKIMLQAIETWSEMGGDLMKREEKNPALPIGPTRRSELPRPTR